MATVSTYLNFPRTTEQAFEFYKSVFGTEYRGPIMRFGSFPATPGQPSPPDSDRDLVMHIELPILGGHILMGTDVSESMGFTLAVGNNIYLNLEPDTKAEADALYARLAEGGTPNSPLADMFWGAYFGTVTDRFGIHWMFNVRS